MNCSGSMSDREIAVSKERAAFPPVCSDSLRAALTKLGGIRVHRIPVVFSAPMRDTNEETAAAAGSMTGSEIPRPPMRLGNEARIHCDWESGEPTMVDNAVLIESEHV